MINLIGSKCHKIYKANSQLNIYNFVFLRKMFSEKFTKKPRIQNIKQILFFQD